MSLLFSSRKKLSVTKVDGLASPSFASVLKFNKNHDERGRFSSGGVDNSNFSPLDRKIINYNQNKPLGAAGGSDLESIKSVIPDAKYVPYSKVPFFDQMNERIGVDPTKASGHEYKDARAAAFMTQPVEQVPIKDITFTQNVVNRKAVARSGSNPHGHPAQVVNHNGKYYLMDGHHRAIVDASNGKTTLTSNVMTINDGGGRAAKVDFAGILKGDLPGHPFRGNQYTSTLGGGTNVEKALHVDTLPLTVSKDVAAVKKALQPYDSKAEIYANAPEALQQLKGWLTDVAVEKLGFKMVDKPPDKMTAADWQQKGPMLFIAPLKGEARAEEKVNGDYGGHWNKLTDVVRCTLATDTVPEMQSALKELQASGMKLAQAPKNNFASPSLSKVGYRDVNLVTRLPNGMLAEVQLNVKDMMAAKNEAHPLYEKAWAIKRTHVSSNGDLIPSKDWPSSTERSTYRSLKADQLAIYRHAWNRHLASYTN